MLQKLHKNAKKTAEAEFDESKIKAENIIKAIEELNYKASIVS